MSIATSTAPLLHSSAAASTAPCRVPLGLRAHLHRSSWASMRDELCATGTFSLQAWRAERARDGRTAYSAVLHTGHATRAMSAVASGPLGALTAMLHEAGAPVEILEFDQSAIGTRTVTFLHCQSAHASTWAMGIREEAGASALDALIAAANRLGR